MKRRTSRFRQRRAYAEVRTYDTEKAAVALELADNTSPFGPPPSALRTLRQSVAESVARYPSTYSRELRVAIGAYIGASPDEILVGAGSDEVMSCAFRALAEPNECLAYMDPTFVMVHAFGATNSLNPTPVSLTANWDLDVEGLLQTGAAITYVCSPNNPTGTALPRASLEALFQRATGIVVLDEAYAEFAGTNFACEAPHCDGVLVLRTFSKAFGMAGLRVGYAVGARPLIAELEKARGPYTVSAGSERAALAALEHDQWWVSSRVTELNDARDWFRDALLSQGYSVLPSCANFVLVRVPNADAAVQALRARGIATRGFSRLPTVGDCVRITVAPRAVMSRVVQALREQVPCA